jgi:hypothetical protein
MVVLHFQISILHGGFFADGVARRQAAGRSVCGDQKMIIAPRLGFDIVAS